MAFLLRFGVFCFVAARRWSKYAVRWSRSFTSKEHLRKQVDEMCAPDKPAPMLPLRVRPVFVGRESEVRFSRWLVDDSERTSSVVRLTFGAEHDEECILIPVTSFVPHSSVRSW